MKMSQRVQRTAENSAVASLCLDKAILVIFKPLKMVLRSSFDGVPLKFEKKNGRRTSSLPARII
jgi:hypothetical protein